ncbi:hypothetical protein WOLCODRAFT_86231, partial [Wolfiporia cocos MD-104 SS10]
IVIFGAYNILTPQKHPKGYLLLQCLRSYLNLDMYLGLEVHTSETITAGEKELLTWSKLIECVASGDNDKNWNFPKVHTHQHAFEDIKAKGVTRNYNTKPSERQHQVLKKSYQLRANKRDFAQQILTAEHLLLVSSLIHEDIDELDHYKQLQSEALREEKEDGDDSCYGSHHIKLGSKLKQIKLSDLEKQHQSDAAFHNFRKRLNKFLTDFLHSQAIQLSGKGVELMEFAKVCQLPLRVDV